MLSATLDVTNTDWVNVAEVNDQSIILAGLAYLVSYRATLYIRPTEPNQEIFTYFAQGDGSPIPLSTPTSFTDTAQRSLIITNARAQQVDFNQTLQLEPYYQFNHYIRSDAPFSVMGMNDDSWPRASNFVTRWRT